MWNMNSNGLEDVFEHFDFIKFQVEQYLMLSEFENNINADFSSGAQRRDIHGIQDETSLTTRNKDIR